MASKTKFEDISIEQYSERSIVVYGDTRKYKEDLKKLGGKYNSRLNGKPGWIFPKTKEGDVNRFINGGERLVSKEEAEAGEARTREWASKRDREKKSTSPPLSSSRGDHSIGEYALLVNMLKDLSRKMEMMKQAVSVLLTPEQREELEEKMKPPSKQKSHRKVIKRSGDKNYKKKKVEPPLSSESDSDSNEEEVELEEVVVVSSDEEEEEEVPRKRLLR